MAHVLIEGLASLFMYAAVAFLLLFVYQLVHDLITPFDDLEERQRGNMAAALNRNGAYVGVLVAAMGSLFRDERPSLLQDVGLFILDGALAIVIFTIACFAFDWIIVRHIDNAELIKQGSVPVAFIEACAYLSLGLIVGASFSGDGQKLIPGLMSALLFSVVGVVTLVVIYAIYCAVWRHTHRCDIDALVGQGSLPAAIDAGTLLLAISVALMFSISGDFTGWWSDVRSFSLTLAGYAVIVPFIRVVASKTLARKLPSSRNGVYHNNSVKSWTVGLTSIGVVVVVGLSAHL